MLGLAKAVKSVFTAATHTANTVGDLVSGANKSVDILNMHITKTHAKAQEKINKQFKLELTQELDEIDLELAEVDYNRSITLNNLKNEAKASFEKSLKERENIEWDLSKR